MENKNKIKRITLLAILTAFALILSIVEHMIELPIPVPGIKLGLPNVVTLFALFYLDVPSALSIIFVRTTLASIFMGRGVTAFAFALTGALFAFVAMRLLLLLYPKFVSLIGVSIVGAAFHNVGQICAATVVMKTTKVFGYLPILLVAAIITGFLIGIVFQGLVRKLSSIRFMQQYFEEAKIKGRAPHLVKDE